MIVEIPHCYPAHPFYQYVGKTIVTILVDENEAILSLL